MRKLSNLQKQKRINAIYDILEYIIFDLWYMWVVLGIEVVAVAIMLILKGKG